MSTSTVAKPAYVGRFAPSPTGPLHFGSLIAAVASYCEAKAQHGNWLIRMEDLDKPREMAGAAADILRTLEGFGFEWYDAILYQSQRAEAYEAALQMLIANQHVYRCICSRKEIADSALQMGLEGKIYPKTCLRHSPEANRDAAFRIVTLDQSITLLDAIQGEVTQNLAQNIGDFVLKRADGLFAYQLAVVVDDAAQGITHVVRGADLLDSTPRQIYLQQLLGFAQPSYAHVPVAVNEHGEKLSKQTLAKPISASLAAQQLWDALQFLGQQPLIEMQNATVNDIWRWAFTNWRLSNVPKTRTLTYQPAQA